MDIVNLAIVLLEVIDMIAATGVGIPSCQREQGMRRGYTHQFYRGPKSDHVYRGNGSAYRNGTTGSYLTCAGMCLQDDACKSFNFCTEEKRCELNAAVFSNVTDLLFFLGCVYFDEDFHEPEAEEPLTECLSPEPLGLEDRTIPNDHITASSEYRSASFARLNGPYGWIADSDVNSWIEVDLDGSKIVSGVITQGDGHNRWWVTQYMVIYAKPPSSSASEYVTDINGHVKIFVGNDDTNTPVTNMFDQSIVATAVRIEPVAWRENHGVAMRLDLLGCRN